MPKNLFTEKSNTILAATPRGGHCEFYVGLDAERVILTSGL